MRAQATGVVVIGRNEGARLGRSFDSLGALQRTAVYVDSGSTDASVALARRRGIEVVALDPSLLLSAARARNAGFRRLVELHPDTAYIQFVDGDCELAEGWLETAATALAAGPGAAVAAGWLRERDPDRSIYHRLADLEWNGGGSGEVDEVGGIFMIRREAFERSGGFDEGLAAGEELELCHRLRAQGWRLLRLDRAMASHDLAMTRFRQWWRRALRFGYASAKLGDRYSLARYRQNNLRVRLWCAAPVLLPAIAYLTASASGMAALPPALAAFACTWPAQLLRIALRARKSGHPAGVALPLAFFTVLAYAPQFAGQALYLADRVRSRSHRLIEHKTPLSGAAVKCD
jgi:GT2 family glycosyltransferase